MTGQRIFQKNISMLIIDGLGEEAVLVAGAGPRNGYGGSHGLPPNENVFLSDIYGFYLV